MRLHNKDTGETIAWPDPGDAEGGISEDAHNVLIRLILRAYAERRQATSQEIKTALEEAGYRDVVIEVSR